MKKQYHEALGKWVVVQGQPGDIKTPGGVLLPDTAVRKKRFGIVLSIGDGISDVIRDKIEEGDTVYYNTGLPIDVDADILAIPEEQLISVLRDE